MTPCKPPFWRLRNRFGFPMPLVHRSIVGTMRLTPDSLQFPSRQAGDESLLDCLIATLAGQDMSRGGATLPADACLITSGRFRRTSTPDAVDVVAANLKRIQAELSAE